MRAQSTNPSPNVQPDDRPSVDRAWFLRGSAWHDAVWLFEPTNALEEASPVRVRWNFMLPSGRRLTDDRYAPLLQSSRQLIASIRSRSICTGLALRASTVAHYFFSLRLLLRWMDREGFTRFADLDATALLQFQRSLTERPGIARATLAPATLQKYLYLLTYLVMNTGAFAVVIILQGKGEGERIEDFRGLGKKRPFLAFSMMMFLRVLRASARKLPLPENRKV